MEISENMARIDKEAIRETKGEIVVYQPDEITRLEVKVNEDTVWLTQTQIAQLFGVGQPAISKHLKNIFASGKLDITAVHSILEYTAADGKSYKNEKGDDLISHPLSLCSNPKIICTVRTRCP